MFILDFPVMIALMLLVYFLAGFRGGIGRASGIVFASIYGVYLVLLTAFFM
jgi:Ca2+/Na+ antiporter